MNLSHWKFEAVKVELAERGAELWIWIYLKFGFGRATQDAGIEIERGSSTNLVLRWNETNDNWELTNNGSTYYDIATTADSFKTSIGDGSATSYTVTHNLGSRDVLVELYDASSYETVIADVTRTSTSVVTVAFTVAPTSNDIRVLIRKI